ncbi:MAG: GTPase ObgE [Paludibacteraceae bacterium]|nr:GTPase ObgE [Paludibacteraceae bacterium]
MSNFIDYVKIFCRSGKGGPGSSHFFRNRRNPKGGPDGGDGGRGGHVILQADPSLWTLIHLKYARHVFASNGEGGGHSRSFGKDGADQIIKVPVGTVAYDGVTGEFICELTDPGQKIVLLKGGRGGQGNWHFKTPTNQAPRYAQPGEPAVEREIVLELKVLADVGLVGFPNAGKSTLLSSVSAAKPQIADYPFTTLVPNLGIVNCRDQHSFCMADIPGIIEGAHDGKGLGLQFLRHIERNSILLFLIPVTSDDLVHEYDVLLNELKLYNPELEGKSRVIAFSKIDVLSPDELNKLKEKVAKSPLAALHPIFFSSVSGENLDLLKDTLWEQLNQAQNKIVEISHRPININAKQNAHIPTPQEEEKIIDTQFIIQKGTFKGLPDTELHPGIYEDPNLFIPDEEDSND